MHNPELLVDETPFEEAPKKEVISAIANIAIHLKMGCTATLMGIAHACLKLLPGCSVKVHMYFLGCKERSTIKNGVLQYTLIIVVEEVLFQHPCLAPIFSRKIVVGCMLT